MAPQGNDERGRRAVARASAVIPVRNGARYLAETIQSVLSQSVPTDCVVVDDRSTDGSGDVARAFGSRVRLIALGADGSLARARNVGWRSAGTEFVGFLDHDDLWAPDKVARQLEVLDREPTAALVCTGLRLMDARGTTIGTRAAPEPYVALRQTLLIELPTMSIAQSSLIRTSVLEDIGGFDERLSYQSDQDLGCRIAMRYPVATLQAALTSYRMHAGQLSEDLELLRHDAAITVPKLFGDPELPPELRRLRRRALANLYYTYAGTQWRRGQHRGAVADLARALLHHPVRSVALARASRTVQRYA